MDSESQTSEDDNNHIRDEAQNNQELMIKVSGFLVLMSSVCITQFTFTMFHLYKEIFLTHDATIFNLKITQNT